MDELSELIIKYFEANKKSCSISELRTKFNIKGELQTDIFNDSLNRLVEDGSLFFNGQKYQLFRNELGLAYGEIEINKSGNGFVCTKDGYKIFIEHKDLNGALNGDKVIIDSIIPGRKFDYKGEVNKILKRKTGDVIFEVVGNGYNASLIPYNPFQSINIDINKNELKNLLDGELILVHVGTATNKDSYIGNIQRIIGHKDDPNTDVKAIAIENGIPIEFSPEALEEAKLLPTEVNEKDIVDRIDLRKKNIVTIDCDNTKDKDDAVYVEKLDNGNYKLIVSISAVNYYVKRGSKLFEEALLRNNSHYINNTCIPMFPHTLSNGICSLNEDVDRLTKSVEMEIDKDGNVKNYNIYSSVINSKKAMKYSEVNKILEGNMVSGYDNFTNDINIMQELSNILEQAKSKRNYIDFNIPDTDIIIDSNGKALDFVQSGIGKAEKIIENFMVITNETIAKHYCWIIPFIFRIHESPNESNVKNVIELLSKSGFRIPKINNINEYTIKSILDKYKDSDCAKVIRIELLKSMKRARYDINNIGHFALQLKDYCHFTSPIRRIADFMIHTVVGEMENFDFNKDSINILEKELTKVSANASKCERISKDMENEGKAMLMAEYMENHIGEEFEVTVTQVLPHGMFVETNNMISGKIKFEDMLDDRYYYDDEKKAIVGKNTKKKYQLGNKICVLVKDASKANRTIDFEISKQKSLRKS